MNPRVRFIVYYGELRDATFGAVGRIRGNATAQLNQIERTKQLMDRCLKVSLDRKQNLLFKLDERCQIVSRNYKHPDVQRKKKSVVTTAALYPRIGSTEWLQQSIGNTFNDSPDSYSNNNSFADDFGDDEVDEEEAMNTPQSQPQFNVPSLSTIINNNNVHYYGGEIIPAAVTPALPARQQLNRTSGEINGNF